MASPSVTYAFTNGTTADATQVNQNFTDLINGLSDGTKDLSISALTAAGNVTLNGNTTLGNASSDDLTVTASLASTIPIKTTATYEIGSSTKGLLALYLGNSTFTTKLATGATASWTFTLPTTAGIAGQGLVNAGSGTMEWKYLTVDTSAKSADYTVTDTDKIRTILMTTGATDRVVTLPTAADNAGRIITVKKVDSGAGKVTVDGENSETVDGATDIKIFLQYESVSLVCDGAAWHVLDYRENKAPVSYTPTYSAGFGTVTTNFAVWRRVGNMMLIMANFTAGTVTAGVATVSLPSGYNGVMANSGVLQGNLGFDYASTASGVFPVMDSTALTVIKFSHTSSRSITNYLGGAFVGNGTVFSLTALVPIAEWQ